MLLASALSSRQLVPLTRVTSTNSAGFLAWLQTPDYQVVVNSGAVDIIAADRDASLKFVAGDVDRLLKAGRETGEAIRLSGAINGASPAWLAVQAYYAAFYYVSAFLKLTSSNLTYARTSDLLRLRREVASAGGCGLNLSTGQWDFQFAPNATSIRVSRPPGSDGIHEGTWKRFRILLNEIIGWLPSSPHTIAEQTLLHAELLQLLSFTHGVGGLPFLSSSRNDVQYRQALGSWWPLDKRLKALALGDVAKERWRDVPAVGSIEANCKSDFARFFNRALGISSVIHQTVLILAKQNGNNFLSRGYARYHKLLVVAPDSAA